MIQLSTIQQKNIKKIVDTDDPMDFIFFFKYGFFLTGSTFPV